MDVQSQFKLTIFTAWCVVASLCTLLSFGNYQNRAGPLAPQYYAPFFRLLNFVVHELAIFQGHGVGLGDDWGALCRDVQLYQVGPTYIHCGLGDDIDVFLV